jgi:nitrile hydratase
MDGMHDLGGRQGFGPVRHSAKATVFHAPWERRVNALLALAVKHGLLNMDEYRHAIERMEPRHTLRRVTSADDRPRHLLVEKGPLVMREPRAAPRQQSFAPSAPGALAPGGAFRPGDAWVKDFVPGHIRMPGNPR